MHATERRFISVAFSFQTTCASVENEHCNPPATLRARVLAGESCTTTQSAIGAHHLPDLMLLRTIWFAILSKETQLHCTVVDPQLMQDCMRHERAERLKTHGNCVIANGFNNDVKMRGHDHVRIELEPLSLAMPIQCAQHVPTVRLEMPTARTRLGSLAWLEIRVPTDGSTKMNIMPCNIVCILRFTHYAFRFSARRTC